MEEFLPIFKRISEHYESPIRVGSRCEANVFYRLEDLNMEDLERLASSLAERVTSVSSPNLPERLVELPGSTTGIAQLLAKELAPSGEELEVISVEQLNHGNGVGKRLKGSHVLLVNDVITTARSCLEAHTKITLMGASVNCWAALIDRTFGPGPVPVVATFTGEPVRLLEELP